MIYLYLNENTIKLLSLSKTLFGQYNIAYFQKNHATRLLEGGRVVTIDLLASAVKEALTLSIPVKTKEKEVCLIMPQNSFEFARFDVPSDISETAIRPFIEDKIRSQTAFSLADVLYDYLLIRQQQESKILFFAQQKNVFSQYYEALRLLGLTIQYIFPDTLCYFTLFAKTLRKDKKENILYLFYQDKDSYGYLYDSLGLLKKEAYRFEDPIETSLHAAAIKLAKEEVKLNRVVLSGVKSENIRQDLFTKKVGVWTNPLKKIISNFYQDYLKLLVVISQDLPLLDFDGCFGAFVAHCENNLFSVKEMMKNHSRQRERSSPSKKPFSLPIIQIRDLVIFLISFIVSFAVIFFYSRVKPLLKWPTLIKFTRPTITPTVIPAPSFAPTPTPTVDKSTIKIKVLNGGGVKGQAGVVRDLLKDEGYGEILTDNADSFDYEKTQVQVKDDKKAAVELLKKDLADYVTIDQVSSLEDDSPADIVLIVGQDFE